MATFVFGSYSIQWGMDALAELKDIYLPPPTDVWSLVIGRHLITSVCVFVLILFIWNFYKRINAVQTRQKNLEQLRHLRKAFEIEEDPTAISIEISQLLRRIATMAYPQLDVISLNGQAWLAFLDQTAKTQQFSQSVGKPLTKNKVEELFDLADKWVRSNDKVVKQ